MSDTPAVPAIPGRPLTLQEIVTGFALLAKENGAADVLVVLCGALQQDQTFARAASMDAACSKMIPALADVIRLHWPDAAKAELVQAIYEMKPDAATQGAVMEPGEWVN